MKQQAFIDYYGPLANDVAGQTGLDPSLVLGQIAQETGWGDHIQGNNIFGISPGGKVASYADVPTAAKAYVDLLNGPNYKGVREAGSSDQQAAVMGARGYNPNPAYPTQISGNAKTVRDTGFNAPSVDDLENMVNNHLKANKPAVQDADAPSAADLEKMVSDAFPQPLPTKPITVDENMHAIPTPAPAPKPENVGQDLEMRGKSFFQDLEERGKRVLDAVNQGMQVPPVVAPAPTPDTSSPPILGSASSTPGNYAPGDANPSGFFSHDFAQNHPNVVAALTPSANLLRGGLAVGGGLFRGGQEVVAQGGNAISPGLGNELAGAMEAAPFSPELATMGHLAGPAMAETRAANADVAYTKPMGEKPNPRHLEPGVSVPSDLPGFENYKGMDRNDNGTPTGSVSERVDALTLRLNNPPPRTPNNIDYLGVSHTPTLLERDPTSENAAKYHTVMKNDGDDVRANHAMINETRIDAARNLNLEDDLESQINRGLKPGLSEFAGTMGDNPISEGRVERLKGIRDFMTSPLRDTALDHAKPADVQPIVDTINKMLAPPDQGGEGFASRPAIANPLNAVLGRLKNEDGTPITDARQLYIIKQSVDDMLNKSVPENAANQTAAKQLSQVKDAIDNQIIEASYTLPQKTDTGAQGPGFNPYREYLKAYHDYSQPINEVRALQDAGFGDLQNSGNVMRLNDVNRVIRKLVNDLQTGGVKSDAASVSNRAWNTIFNLRDDLARTENVINPATGALKSGVATAADISKFQNKLADPSMLKKGMVYGAATVIPPAVGALIGGVPGAILGTGADLGTNILTHKLLNSMSEKAKTNKLNKYSKEVIGPMWQPPF